MMETTLNNHYQGRNVSKQASKQNNQHEERERERERENLKEMKGVCMTFGWLS